MSDNVSTVAAVTIRRSHRAVGDNVSTVAAITVRRSHRTMRNNVSTVAAIAIGGCNRPVRNQPQAARTYHRTHSERQNKNCANCSTHHHRATKFCHF